MTITVGAPAPEAALVALVEGKPGPVRIAELKGAPALLLFFPLVNTGGCHAELCTVRDSLPRYHALKARVIAISVDSPFAFALWAEKEGYQFEFWSDFNGEATRAFGCRYESLAGLKGVAKRSAFILDAAGVVRYAWVSDDSKRLPDWSAIQAELERLG